MILYVVVPSVDNADPWSNPVFDYEQATTFVSPNRINYIEEVPDYITAKFGTDTWYYLAESAPLNQSGAFQGVSTPDAPEKSSTASDTPKTPSDKSFKK
jgi:hypothetical protein